MCIYRFKEHHVPWTTAGFQTIDHGSIGWKRVDCMLDPFFFT